MVRTKQQRKRNRRKADPALTPPPPTVLITTVTHATGAAVVVFNGTVQLAAGSFPSTWTVDGNAVTAATQLSPNSISIMTSVAIIATNPYIFPGYDPAIRTPTGGYVDPKAGTVA